MSQHDSLRERIEQHKPKNIKSKIDDKDVYKSMELVRKYLKEKREFQDFFNTNWELDFSRCGLWRTNTRQHTIWRGWSSAILHKKNR